VLIVVSAGNNLSMLTGDAKAAEAVLKNHTMQLRTPEARLADPATAAIAITVGALVEHEVPAARRGTGAADIIRSLGKIAEPSPFTCVGAVASTFVGTSASGSRRSATRGSS